MLNVGEKVFIPQYGGGIVAAIEEREVLVDKYKYVIIYLYIDNMELSIREDRIETYGLRGISSNDKMQNALIMIQEKPLKIEAKWNKRYQQNKRKIESGDLMNITEVVRDLQYLKKNSLLPTGEQKILERAKEMLASEIMLISEISLKEAMEEIEEIDYKY